MTIALKSYSQFALNATKDSFLVYLIATPLVDEARSDSHPGAGQCGSLWQLVAACGRGRNNVILNSHTSRNTNLARKQFSPDASENI